MTRESSVSVSLTLDCIGSITAPRYILRSRLEFSVGQLTSNAAHWPHIVNAGIFAHFRFAAHVCECDCDSCSCCCCLPLLSLLER